MQEFREIFTALFNGNVGEAKKISEQMSYEDVFNISEEYDRRNSLQMP